jgi:hypothetical protein
MIRLLCFVAMAMFIVSAHAADAAKSGIDALESYVGYYLADSRIQPDSLIEISRTGDRLTVQIPGQPRITLIPNEADRFTFYLPEVQTNVTLTFTSRKNVRAERVIMRRNGLETVMTRIDVKSALEVADRAMLNGWFSSAPGLSPAPSPATPHLPTWILLPRTTTSIPLGTAVLDNVPPPIATMPLAKHGYVEEEYIVSGKANIYAIGGKRIWRADLPYTTRILVRRPADPAAFSGTIHLEPTQDGSELPATLMGAWPYFVRNGDIFVAWTAAKDNVSSLLQKFDPQRYAALSIPANGLRWDMMAQIAWLLRSSEGPLGKAGFNASAAQKAGGLRVYSTGSGATAEMQALFVNDGFHARARTPYGEPVIDAYVPAMNIQRITPQEDAFIVRIMTESEFANPGTYDQPGAWVTRPAFRGQPINLREYHIAGTSHADWDDQPQFNVVFHQLGISATMMPKCAQPIAQLPGKRHVVRALFAALDSWVREGKTPPPNRLFLLDPDHKPVRDPISGNVVGSLRPFWINIPTARFGIDNTGGSPASPISAAICKHFAYQVPFAKSRMAELYGGRANYLERVSQHLERMVKQRYLLPEEAAVERVLAEEILIP